MCNRMGALEIKHDMTPLGTKMMFGVGVVIITHIIASVTFACFFHVLSCNLI
jgi:hypothetical protein